MQALDIVVRVSASTLFLTIAAMVARDPAARRLAPYLAAFCLGVIGVLGNNAPADSALTPGLAGAALSLLSGTAALWLWLFGLALFDDRFRIAPLHLGIGAVWLALAAADRGLMGARLEEAGLSRVLIVMAICMAGHLAWRVLRDREGDLITARRDARPVLAAAMIGYLTFDIIVDLIFGFASRPLGLTLLQNTLLLAVAIWLTGRLLSANPGPLLFTAPFPSARKSAPREDPLLGRLQRLIEVDRVHLNPALKLADFAAMMGASEANVRRLVNERLGHGHFRSFLNAHRVEEAKRRLSDPARAEEKIASIALDSGFASLASFGRAFQEAEGMTPSAYRRAALCGLSGSEQRSAVF